MPLNILINVIKLYPYTDTVCVNYAIKGRQKFADLFIFVNNLVQYQKVKFRYEN